MDSEDSQSLGEGCLRVSQQVGHKIARHNGYEASGSEPQDLLHCTQGHVSGRGNCARAARGAECAAEEQLGGGMVQLGLGRRSSTAAQTAGGVRRGLVTGQSRLLPEILSPRA